MLVPQFKYVKVHRSTSILRPYSPFTRVHPRLWTTLPSALCFIPRRAWIHIGRSHAPGRVRAYLPGHGINLLQAKKFTSGAGQTNKPPAPRSRNPCHDSSRDGLAVDVVIAGSGVAALSAALTASMSGLVPLVVEKSSKWGGTSAKSAGGMWLPNNSIERENGVEDSMDTVLKYLDSLLGDSWPSSTIDRRRAFIQGSDEVVKAFRAEGFNFSYGRTFLDYHDEYPTARSGRMLEPKPFDTRRLGPWQDTMRRRGFLEGAPILVDESAALTHAMRSSEGALNALRVVWRTITSRLRGQQLVTMGMSLVGQLMYLVQRRGIMVWLNSPIRELLMEDGQVRGVVVEKEGRKIQIYAHRGVLLGVGGFAQNDILRRQYSNPGRGEWSIAIPEDVGDGLELGLAAGADTSMLDIGWWVPLAFPPGEHPFLGVREIASPMSIMVDRTGQRFVNEAASYQDVGAAMIKVGAFPAWLIMDTAYRRRYFFGYCPPGITPGRWLREGFMIKADTLEELAQRCEIDAAGLIATVERFNQFAEVGVDEDFHRGDTKFNRHHGDPTIRPNPTLGLVKKPPFYAVRFYPGDAGTKGGLLVDEHWRVVSKLGGPIGGLYAAGNTTASVLGDRYPGPGSTLGPAMVGGYIAMRHAAGKPVEIDPESTTPTC